MKNQRAFSWLVAFSIILGGAYIKASIKANRHTSIDREKIQAESQTQLIPQLTTNGRTLTSSDGKTQIQLPQGWVNNLTEKDSGRFQIKAKNPSRGLHLSVASQSFRKAWKGVTLEQIAKVPVMGMKNTLASSQLEQTKISTVNGHRAVQYKLQGVAHNGAELTFLSTVVETPTNYHVVFAGSPTLAFNQHQAELQQVIQSFKEIKVTANR